MPRARFVVLLALLAAAVNSPADYMLPEPVERFVILADPGSVVPVVRKVCECIDQGKMMVMRPKTFYEVHVARGKSPFEWSIDLMWLADRIDSDSICTGSHEAKMTAYLKTFISAIEPGDPKDAGSRADRPLLVELVTTKKDDPLFVAGIRAFDAAEAFARGKESGFPPLDLTAEQVQKLGNADALLAQVRAHSEEAWKALVARPKAAEAPADSPAGDQGKGK